MLDGADEGRQLGRCEVRQSRDDTSGYDENVLEWLSPRNDEKKGRDSRPGTIGLRLTIAYESAV